MVNNLKTEIFLPFDESMGVQLGGIGPWEPMVGEEFDPLPTLSCLALWLT